jgi:hypothetical protein
MHSSPNKEVILLGKWTPEKLDILLHESSEMKIPLKPPFPEVAPGGLPFVSSNNTGIRIGYLSEQFLGTPYQESTLIGDTNTPEVFVINLEAVDCFTFLDYIESMRRSVSFDEFRENLRKVRYRGGEINFQNRNHFFTDWREVNSNFIDDVTGQLGGKKVVAVIKLLNQKDDGTYFLPGIQPRERSITYIPVNMIDDSILSQLRTGDYIGIYSEKEGLDVSHVGIFIKKENKTYLRHASSHKEHRKVVDQDFSDYIADKPGILVFRSKKNSSLCASATPSQGSLCQNDEGNNR